MAAPPLEETRRTLHGLAELLVAGPQFRSAGTMRLAVRPGGFGTSRASGPVSLVAVDGTELVVVRGGTEGRWPVAGPYGELAAAAGLEIGGLEGAYPDSSGLGPADRVSLDAGAAALLADGWATGDAALRELCGGGPPEPVLWPEHFDVAVSLDGVNYGVSPGDAAVPEPYAYVGPPEPPAGEFWNQPFGASRTLRSLDGGSGVLAFFREGRSLL